MIGPAKTYVKQLRLCLCCVGLLCPLSGLAQFDFTEDLSLFANLERVQVRADYGFYSGWEPWGIGGSLHGFYDTDDEEEYAGLIFAGYAEGDTAFRIGGGYQQRDQATDASPVIEARWVRKLEPFADFELYVQDELDGAGLGLGLRYHLVAEVLDWIDLDVLLEASYFEELKEDLDGYAAILFEPFSHIDVLHIGPAVSLDEDGVEVGLIFLVAN